MSLRIAVVGVGHLGKHHARILSSMPGVELVAVVDTNKARAEEVASATRTAPWQSESLKLARSTLLAWRSAPISSASWSA